MPKGIGLYLHIPFCEKKCAYCDFYSAFLNEELMDKYVAGLIKEIKQWGGKTCCPIDTIYLGGGTPSLLSHRIIPLLDSVRKYFDVSENAEITLELNPSSNTEKMLDYAIKAGVNRLSIGAESGNDDELKVLGRSHTVNDTISAVSLARSKGFENISLDIMLGLPSGNIEKLQKSLDFLLSMQPEHISAYILKIEENTKFSYVQKNLDLPDDDEQAEQYMFMCNYLEKSGYNHYEISNFCTEDNYSRHNLKYWNDEEYLGLGASAHSFYGGKRFYYPRDIKGFINGINPIPDGFGGDSDEYIMLHLRLKDGIDFKEYNRRFGKDFPQNAIEKCRHLANLGLIKLSEHGFYLTDTGMLVSNSIITEISEALQ